MDYERLTANAYRTLKNVGVSVTLTRAQVREYNPASSRAEALPVKSFSGYGVRDQYGLTLVDNVTILSGDVRLYLAFEDNEAANPQAGDSVSISGGEVWNLVSVTPVRPANVTVLFDCQARKP